ncbi:amino acid permease [Nostoc sp. CENA67]|uniref:histidine kinase n=1 Tax=Amazonocrinis nigriterrae CENA67 TaxID=2794033 RepID=A0A8J7HPL7_9NOST|nr:ATP-binding protein [Amazonocrinis nigriterrae]MBH8561348.1 amino acid permease [Amazonocrinis nigriterrae CENA67]
MFHSDNAVLHRPSFRGLPRSLSSWETWAFGLTSHLAWTSVVPAVHAALGTQAIFVWIPAVILGMLLNYQIKHLGKSLFDVAGGTPNYTTKLWQRYPIIARYAAIGYLLGWLSFLSVNAVVLTDLIKVNFEALGISFPEAILRITFILLPFVVAFSGTRALSILHLFFAIPACVLLLTFCLQGLGFLAFSSNSPGFFPNEWSSLSFVDWAKWFYFASYTAYSCETASSFVADSREPDKTLRFLDIAAWLMLPVLMGGSWVIMRLATAPDLEDNAFLNFVAASTPFWGNFAPAIVTFLLAGSCLLGSATTVSNCPRIIYQLAVDEHLAPVFSVVSPRGVFGSSLTLSLILGLIYFIWGNVAHIIAATNAAWFISIMLLHLGLWQQRAKFDVVLPKLTLGIFLLEILILLAGSYAWGWQDSLIGLLVPFGVLAIDALVRRIRLPIFRSSWWLKLYQSRRTKQFQDSVMLQVSILIFLLCSAVLVGCLFGWYINKAAITNFENLVVVLLMTVAFVGVTIACWTSLPQVVAITEAREAAEHLFHVAQDGIVVTDEQGIVCQANPAIEFFFGVNPFALLGHHLNKWLPELAHCPQQWTRRSEHTILYKAKIKNLEVSISDRPHQDFREYVVILHDITRRKQAEEILRQSEAKLREEAKQLATQLVQSEKMSSLGQLVAGVAHEINNPVNFIYGNLTPASEYIQDLLKLLLLYQQHYPNPVVEIQEEAEAIDIDFLLQDLPQLLTSMKVGAQRIKEIVLSLRNFSRLDEAEMKEVNIHDGIDSTLMILEHRLKEKTKYPAIAIIKEYGNIPLVECYAGQLNQVFMNILANAIDTLEEAFITGQNLQNLQIRIKTELRDNKQVIICIADNGTGMSETVQKQLFDPFFTTKPIGKGTGLGLSISYKIITEKHQGRLHCISCLNQGTEFLIEIPLRQYATTVDVRKAINL